jgi:hypothetical protein
MKHRDSRAEGKIFATLAYPDDDWGMVKLTPEQQKEFVGSAADVFVPVKGAWGRRGCTNVRLRSASKRNLHRALRAA